MKKEIQWVFLAVLLWIATLLVINTINIYKAPLGLKELTWYTQLWMSTKECETCKTKAFYRENREWSECDIYEVTLDWDDKNILWVKNLSLETWVQEKGDSFYIFDIKQHTNFEEKCYSFPKIRKIQ